MLTFSFQTAPLLLAVLAINLMSLLDAISTLLLVDTDSCNETNPLMKALIDTNFLISFGVITLLFALIYKFLPDAEIAWKDVWFGAAITSLFFTIGNALIELYLGRSTVSSMYGAARSLIIVLKW